MTESFLAKARAARGQPEYRPPAPPIMSANGSGRGYGQAALVGEVLRVRLAAPGTRNDALNRAAFSLGQLVAGGELTEDQVRNELTDAARAAGLDEREIGATIASGLGQGMTTPRRAPQLTDSEIADRAIAAGFVDPLAETLGYLASPESRVAKTINGVQPDGEPGGLLEKLRAALVDASGLDAIPEPEPLIREVLYRNSTAWLIGPPANAKSFVALDFAGCVGTGEPWQGCRVEQGLVLYMVAEGLSGVRQRVRAWEASMGRPMEGVQFLPVAVQAANRAEWVTFVDLAAELRPTLIVIDTQARVTVGMEENSAKDMGEFVQRVEQLRVATGACVMVVHHQGRSGEHMRGSTALEGAATTIIRVKKDDDMVTVECAKQKDAPEFAKISLRLVSSESSAILALTDGSSGGDAVRAFGKEWVRLWWKHFESEPVSVSQLTKAEIVAEATFHRDKFPLVRGGYVVKEGTETRPRYRLMKQP